MTSTNSTFYSAKDIMDILQVGKSKAYKVIAELNAVLKEKGYIVVAGKVSKYYFKKRFYDFDIANAEISE